MLDDLRKVFQIVVLLPFKTTKYVIFALDFVSYLLAHRVEEALDVHHVPLNVELEVAKALKLRISRNLSCLGRDLGHFLLKIQLCLDYFFDRFALVKATAAVCLHHRFYRNFYFRTKYIYQASTTCQS